MPIPRFRMKSSFFGTRTLHPLRMLRERRLMLPAADEQFFTEEQARHEAACLAGTNPPAAIWNAPYVKMRGSSLQIGIPCSPHWRFRSLASGEVLGALPR